jgi:hypothetical protein
MRSFAQSAFVDEDDRAPLAERSFLIWGQRYFFQCRIPSSSRSSAFPIGRWQLPGPEALANFGVKLPARMDESGIS